MRIPSKTRKDQKTDDHTIKNKKNKNKSMSIAAKANQVCKNIEKPMSRPSKTRKDQKAQEHISKSEPGVQKRQKTHEPTIKNKKRSKNPRA